MRGDGSGIAGWTKNSFIDFPGTVSTVLFFSGCNLRCPYCHNPGIVLNETKGIISLEDVLDFLKKRKGIIEGVVLSGGEPTIHENLEDIVKELRKLKVKIKLDTNGLLPEKIKKIRPDYLALDVKTTPVNYKNLLKAPYDDVEKRLAESISIARSMDENAEIRITISPKIIDNKIIEDVGKMIQGVKKVFLQPMQTKVEMLEQGFMELPLINAIEINKYRELLLNFTENCTSR
jgi:pyruvate formate lyase activating enzyme